MPIPRVSLNPWLLALPALAAVAAYLPAVAHQLVWDDPDLLGRLLAHSDPAEWWDALQRPLIFSPNYFQQLGAGVQRPGVGHGEPLYIAQFQYCSYHALQLQRSAHLDILEHRCLVAANLFGASHASVNAHAQVNPQAMGHGIGLRHRGPCHC